MHESMHPQRNGKMYEVMDDVWFTGTFIYVGNEEEKE
jgi:hypothetical protein